MIIIAEKVNATRKSIRKALDEHNSAFISKVIKEQDQAGADYIDLNAGSGSGGVNQESFDMKWLVDVALEATEKNLCIDSADPVVLTDAAEHIGGKRPWMLNSIKCERESLDSLMPIVKEYDVPFIALCMDEEGVPKDVDTRLRICETFCEDVSKRGMETSRIFLDPLAIPLINDTAQVSILFKSIEEMKSRFSDVKTTIGVSNISHGLPKRSLINQGFLIRLIACGIDSAITDPTHPDIQRAICVGNALAGHDRHCRKYTRACRKNLL